MQKYLMQSLVAFIVLTTVALLFPLLFGRALQPARADSEVPLAPEDKSVDYWLAELRSPETIYRVHAVTALETLGARDPEVLAALVELTRDQESDVRTVAAYALGKLAQASDEVVVAALAARLEDRSRVVRLQAIQALSALPGKRAIEALSEGVADEDFHVRMLAIRQLGRLGPQARAAAPALRAAFDVEQGEARSIVADCLRKIEGDATAQLR